jgi:hypothetical protein
MTSKRRCAVAVACASVIISLCAMPPAAHASGTGGGSVQFDLTANLPTFPCPPPGCTGSFGGSSTGVLAGMDGNNPWTVTWIPGAPAQSTANGSFTYADSCAIPIGVASGTGSLTANVGFVTGTYGPPVGSTALPYPVVGVHTDFSFDWSRVGLAAVVTTSVSVTIKVAEPSGVIVDVPVVGNHLDVAVAAFAPTGAVVPTCAAPGPLAAVVGASDLISN